MLCCKCPAFWYILPSINTIFFHTFECFWSVWYFFYLIYAFASFFACAHCSHIAWCDTVSRDHFVWTAIKLVDGIQGLYICIVILFSLFLSFVFLSECFLWYSNLISGVVVFSHFHRRNIHSNGGYLNDRHLKIIQFKSHFLAEIGNVDTFICACYSRSYCSSSSHFNKRAQCPEKQIVWLSFASPSKMCAHIMCMQAWWHSNKTFK